MRRSSSSRSRTLSLAAIVVCLLALVPVARASADRVVLRDGSELSGYVVSLDRELLVMELPGDERREIPRREVARIEFGEEELPPLDATVRVLSADDEVHLYLDGREVAAPAELEAEWFDLAPLLADGTNELTAEVVNVSGPWAYRWVLRVGGKKYTFACGLAGKSGCRRGEGATGREKGTFFAGRAWLYVHRADGTIDVEIEEEE